jgi:ketosteroid isomerase-like protein
MTDEQQPAAHRFAELPQKTQDFLAKLSADDIETIEKGLPILQKIMGAGQVAKWIGFFVLSMAAGVVLLGESIGKILAWFKGA